MALKLIIGGYAQGKLDYVLQNYHLDESVVWDGNMPEDRLPGGDTVIINYFQSWVKKRMMCEGCPEQETKAILARYQNCIIICDEIGNGIVPMEALEREYRELVGRLLIMLADRAMTVERVVCGIGQRIK